MTEDRLRLILHEEMEKVVKPIDDYLFRGTDKNDAMDVRIDRLEQFTCKTKFIMGTLVVGFLSAAGGWIWTSLASKS